MSLLFNVDSSPRADAARISLTAPTIEQAADNPVSPG